MKKVIFSISVLLICCWDNFSQNNSGIVCTVSSPQYSLGYLDPLQIEITLINNSANYYNDVWPLDYDGYTFYYTNAFLEYKYNKDTSWIKIELPSKHLNLNYHGSPFVQFAPSDSIKSGLIKIPNFLIGRRSASDNVQIRILLQPRAPNFDGFSDTSPFITSPEKTLNFKEYTNEDYLAYVRLKNLNQPDFMYKPFYYGFAVYDCMDTKDTIECPFLEVAKGIVKDYPMSKFTPWCQIYLAIHYNSISIIQASLNIDKSKEYLGIAYNNTLPLIKADDKVLRYLSESLMSFYFPNTIRTICSNTGGPNGHDCYYSTMNALKENKN